MLAVMKTVKCRGILLLLSQMQPAQPISVVVGYWLIVPASCSTVLWHPHYLIQETIVPITCGVSSEFWEVMYVLKLLFAVRWFVTESETLPRKCSHLKCDWVPEFSHMIYVHFILITFTSCAAIIMVGSLHGPTGQPLYFFSTNIITTSSDTATRLIDVGGVNSPVPWW
jgi:hypothetical protein